jgi:predicted DNA-binding protein YlxM (UPF0122 family)
MTDDIRRFGFLLRQLPVCTQSPVKVALGPDIHRELRAKYKLELGIDLLEDRCPNSFNCQMNDDDCIGRPFPIDNQILQALGTLNVEVSKGIFKGREVYLAQATVTCAGCPFSGHCETSCATQDSFLNRSTKPESNPPESSLVPYEDFERGMYKALTPEDVEHCGYGDWKNQTLPLDCLTPKQRQVIEMTYYQGLEQSVVAQEIHTTKQDVSQTIQLALNRLEEFGRARKALHRLSPKPVVDYYAKNMTQIEISLKYSIDQGNLSKSISKWFTKNCT